MKKLITLTLIAISSIVVQAQNYVTDGLFGNGGQVYSVPLLGTAGYSKAIFKQPDGKLLLGGYMYDIGCNCFYNMMFRINECGEIDSSFGVNGLVKHTFDQSNQAEAFALQPDGKILVAGLQSSSNAGSQQFPFVARYNYDGSVDSSFGTNGTNKIDYLNSGYFTYIYLMADGKILCSGNPGRDNHYLVRFDSTGTVDNTFGVNGVIQHPMPPGGVMLNGFESKMRSDGKIISVTSEFFNQSLLISCYDTLGIVDSSFGQNGYYFDPNFIFSGYTPKLIIQSDDKFIVAMQNNVQTNIILARYTIGGVIDSTFGTNGYASTPGSSLEYMSIFNDDSFLIGYVNGSGSQFTKYSANGVSIPVFSLDGSNIFQFPTGSGERAQIGLDLGNDEFVVGSTYAFNNGTMAYNKFGLSSLAPNITQNIDTLFSNVGSPGAIIQWYLNDAAIGGANDSIYVTSQNGTYVVEVTNSIGCTATDTIMVTNTGLVDQKYESLVSFFPNPVNDFMSFENQVGKELALNIYDISGKLMLTTKINSGSGKIDLSFLTAGVYMVEVKNDVAVSKTRIIKQ